MYEIKYSKIRGTITQILTVPNIDHVLIAIKSILETDNCILSIKKNIQDI